MLILGIMAGEQQSTCQQTVTSSELNYDYVATLPVGYRYCLTEFTGTAGHYRAVFHASIHNMDGMCWCISEIINYVGQVRKEVKRDKQTVSCLP